MKSKNLFLAVLIMAFTISCKNDKKDDATGTSEEKLTVKENFSVELDVVSAQKDDFALYYTEDNTINFDGSRASWKGVNGGNVNEKVVLELSEEIIPTHIRLDFGINKEQDFVQINTVKIIYYGQEISFKGSDLYNWFIKDDNFNGQVDVASGSIKFMKNDGEYKTPYFYPRQELVDAIKKMTTSKG